jgi:hypothetical protein
VPSPFETCLTLAPPEVLGRRLAPFTLGHAHLLEICRSPFVAGGAQVDASDLVLAVWICSFKTYADAKRAALAALAGRVPRNVRKWGKRVGAAFDAKAESEKLAKYLGDCTRPPRMVRRADAKGLATPAAATLAVLHRHYFHTPEAAAWDLPFLGALLDVMTFHHAQGWVEIVGDKQAAFIDAVAKMKTKKAGAPK